MTEQNTQFHFYIRSAAWGVISGTALIALMGTVYWLIGENARHYISDVWRSNYLLWIFGLFLYSFIAQLIYRSQRSMRGLPEEPTALDWSWHAGYLLPWGAVIALVAYI